MKIIEITKKLTNINKRIFNIVDLGKIFNSVNKNTIYKTAERLVNNGILKRLNKGLYINTAKAPDIFEIANYLYTPSYISLESALYRYGVISQSPYLITSVTPKKPKKIIAEGTDFEYVHITAKYFFGYVSDKGILIATREKALIDLLYLISKKARRFNLTNLDLKEIDRKRFKAYLKHYSYLPLINLLKRITI